MVENHRREGLHLILWNSEEELPVFPSYLCIVRNPQASKPLLHGQRGLICSQNTTARFTYRSYDFLQFLLKLVRQILEIGVRHVDGDLL